MKILMRADTHYSIAVRSDYDEPKYTFSQVLAAIAVSLGSMVVGFSSAYTSPALVTMQNDTSINVSEEEASWVGGLMPLAALAGGVFGGPLVDYIGRRRTILFTAPPFFVAWIFIATATSVQLVLTGRAICGVCVGIGSLAFPVYLGETIQPEVRGVLGLFPTAIGNIGILLCYTAGKYLDWSQLAYLGAALPVPFFILMLLIPETPRWYVNNNRLEDAKKALQWLRGKNAVIDNEIRDIQLTEAETQDSESTIRELFSKKSMKSICISLGLMAFQQLSGINAVIFYTVKIFKMSGSSVDENLSTIIVGIVNFVSVFIATGLIDRCGRKILLYISSVSMILTLVILGTFFHVRDSMGLDVATLGWLPLTSLMVYLLGFSMGFGPIPWLMMGEILPAKIRGPAASICTAFNWLCTFGVTKSFHNLLDAIGPNGAFWLFGCICFVGLFFVVVCVPETRGKSLEQIENKLTGRPKGRTRRLSSIANIKPLPSGC
ncbi:facilitated trehalose transporter Tret1 isoform X1 [Leguminivora glycinivorella]|uniref:facilitated trehalose transporter Tret1 isoform X1 n=1 Tax=Leguminivora glycinivorella TaxID=1035111 RepID=UPI00200D2D5F|nr:facilitated trehalose transporter Tret1 isoform X1 [Leguminivora glycinivorella]